MSYELPESDASLIEAAKKNYLEQGAQSQDATFEFIWALVHSSETSNVKLGLDMAKVFLEEELTTDSRRNVKYCIAVALFKSRSYVAARRELNLIIEEFKDFRQAIHLKELTEEKLVREGVIGVAIAGATVVGAGAIAIAASLLKR